MRTRGGCLVLALLVMLCAWPACAQDAQTRARTNCDANVRKGPSSGEDIAFVLAAGAEVIVTGTVKQAQRAWCAIALPSMEGKKGYILRELLDFAAETPAVDAAQAAPAGLGRLVTEAYYLAAL